MYICSILKCCISSSNEITPNIKKSSSIVERHIAGVVNLIARCSLSPNWCIQYSWKKLSPMKSQTVPYLHRCCVYHRVTVFLYFIIHINPLYIWMMFSDWVIKWVLFYHFLFFFPLTPHRGGICPLGFRIMSTSQLYQFIGQYRSRPTIIEEIHVVWPG